MRRWNEIAGLGPSILGARDALDQLYDYLSALSADARIRLGGVARTRIAREESKVNPVRWRLILWSAVELAKRFFKKEKPKPVPCESEPELDEDESEAAAALRR